MSNDIDFATAANLKKWPSLAGERISSQDGAVPYTLVVGTLVDCIRGLLSKPEAQRHLYEIHLENGQLLSATDALAIRYRPDFPRS